MVATASADYDMMARALLTMGATDEEVDIPKFSRDLEQIFRQIESMDSDLVVGGNPAEGFQAQVVVDDTQVGVAKPQPEPLRFQGEGCWETCYKWPGCGQGDGIRSSFSSSSNDSFCMIACVVPAGEPAPDRHHPRRGGQRNSVPERGTTSEPSLLTLRIFCLCCRFSTSAQLGSSHSCTGGCHE